MNAPIIRKVAEWATGQPLPEHDWRWRRVFAFGMVFLATMGQLAVMYGIYNLISTVTYYSTQATTTFDLQRAIAAQQMMSSIIPSAMQTIFWMVIMQGVSINLMQLYYMVAPSAETLKGMTVAMASIRNGGAPQPAPAPTPTPTPTPTQPPKDNQVG